MPSSYSTNLKIELQATGENSGTWGTITNTNLGTALEQAIVGYGNPSYASDANLTLTYTDTNAAQAARALVLNVTSAVSLSATRELVVPTIQKQYIVQNNTTGAQSITVKTSGGTGITVPNGRKAHLYVDGTNVIYMDDFVDINGGTIDGTVIGGASAAAATVTTLSATGVATFSAGTVSAPAITTSGDTNTGIFFPAADTIAFTEGGTESMRIDPSGNMGLGVTPSAWTTASGRKAIEIGALGNAMFGNGTSDFYMLSNAYRTVSNFIYANNGPAAAYRHADAAHQWSSAASGTAGGTISFTQTMTLDSSGNLGIGTSSPAVRLDVSGFTNITNASSALSGTAKGTLRLYDSTAMASGVGAGLAFLGQATTGSGTYTTAGSIQAYKVNGTSGNDAFGLQFTTRANGSGCATVMTLDDSGNLGLGTSSPSQKLHVYQALTNSTAYGIFENNRSRNAAVLTKTTNGGFYTGTSVGTDTLCWQVYDETNGERLRIDSSGNLGLGVTPSAWTTSFGIKALQVGPSSAIVGSNNNTNVAFNVYFDGTNERYIKNGFASTYVQDSGKHTWSTAPSGTAGNAITSTTAMTLDASGRLGIGTTTPANPLQIVSNTTSQLNVQALSGNTNAQINLEPSGTGIALIGPASTFPLAFRTDNAERARITSGGQFLVGATTSVGGLNKAIELSSAGISENQGGIFVNQYVASGNATNTGYLTFHRSGSGTLGTNTLVAANDRLGMVRFSGANGTGFTPAAEIYAEVDGTPGASNDMPGRIVFATTKDGEGSATERARITAAGQLLVGQTTNQGQVTAAASGNHGFTANVTTGSAYACFRGRQDASDTARYYLWGSTGGVDKVFIFGNGDIQNANNSYGVISDQKLKKDITDASSQWDDIKNVRIRKYKYINDAEGTVQIGVVAQELEQVSPGLVYESPDFEEIEAIDEDGNTTIERKSVGSTKAVKTSVLYMKAVKALQEAMARIEQLEAKVTALESK